MESDLNELIKQTTTMPSLPDRKPRIVIMEGFVLFHHRPLFERCDIRFFVSASEPVCKERRLRTSAWVTPGIFI
jgi:uridine kinase